MVRGGAGYFLGRLTLATSFRDPHYANWVTENTRDIDQMYPRPVIELKV